MRRSSLTASDRLLAFLERGVPEESLQTAESRRRVHLIAGTAYILAGVCLVTLPVLAVTMEGPARALSLVVTALVLLLAVVTLWLLRSGARAAVAGSFMTAIILAGIGYAVATNGGFASPYWILLPLVPLVATQMAGRVAGLVWSALGVGGILLLLALEASGVELPRFTSDQALHATAALYGVLAVISVQVLSHLSDVAKDDAVARAAHASAQLERADLEVERARILAQQAVAASAAKSAFMATMSHELRTPLNAVIGYAEILVEEAEERAIPSMRDDLVRIVGASQHLLGLIDDILDLSRVEADKLDLRRERFVAQDVVREVVLALEPLARKHRNVLETRFDESPIVADLDRGRLRQVLLNLINNAIKFTAQGRVVVGVRAEAAQGQHWLVIAVEDTGIGIDEADQARIFEAFTQVDSSPRRRYEGSGLGLSLCKRLVEMMGGAIEVRSQLGRGSTFTVRLPVAAPARAAPATPVAAC